MNTKEKRLTAFNYFGGKSRMLDWLYTYFPNVTSYRHYVEPFCGSAVVFLNKPQSPIETLNDKDGRIMNFFRVLREQPAKLIEMLDLTPYNRNEFNYAYRRSEDPVEDARRFFVRAMMCYGGGGNGEGSRRVNSFRMQWTESRRGVSLEVSKWWTKVAGLQSIVPRLLNAQMQNTDAMDLIEAADALDTFFFCDPPYPHDGRTGKTDYNHEMDNNQHIELSTLLHSCKGYVMICGYASPLMKELYSDWTLIPGPKKATNLGKSFDENKRECIWTNYKPESIVTPLFS